MRSNVFVSGVITLLLLTGCDSPTAPEEVSSDGGTVASVTRFDGVLDPGGASFYSFTTQQTGSVRATLQSLTAPGRPEVVSVPLSVGVGVPRGEGCAVSESVETPSGLVTQFVSSTLAPGTYCLSVRDPGRLPFTVTFVVSFSYL